MGKQVILGKFPFIDFFSHYGPLTMMTSAVGLWLTGSLLGEVLICVGGYGLSLFLIFIILRPCVPISIASLAVAVSLAVLPRFYKWYYWLFPLLALYLFSLLVIAKTPMGRFQVIAAAGLGSGMAFLYRIDLGLACTTFYLISYGAFVCWGRVKLLSLRELIVFLMANVTPIALWLIILFGKGGESAVFDYFRSTLFGAVGAIRYWSVPIPIFNIRAPLSVMSGTAVLYLLLPFVYVSALVTSQAILSNIEEKDHQRGSLIFGSGLMGIALLPQSLHRSDTGHLLQVMAPFIVCAPLLGYSIWRASGKSLIKKVPLGKILVVICLTSLAFSLFAVRHSCGIDFQCYSWPWTRYSSIVGGIEEVLNNPVALVSRRIKQLTENGDAVLVLSLIHI